MPATMHEIGAVLNNRDDWTAAEKWAVKWQVGLLGGFDQALAGCLKQADEANLMRLETGFPVQVNGFKQWVHGDLAERLRKAGLDI